MASDWPIIRFCLAASEESVRIVVFNSINRSSKYDTEL